MKYRVIGVQYYVYETEAESKKDALEGFSAMMHYGTSSEIDRMKHNGPVAFRAIEMEN